MFSPVRGLKADSKEVEGGSCMKGIDRKLCFSEKERHKFWKDYMKRIIDEENDRDHVEGNAVEGAVFCLRREDVVQALNEMKQEKPLDLQ